MPFRQSLCRIVARAASAAGRTPGTAATSTRATTCICRFPTTSSRNGLRSFSTSAPVALSRTRPLRNDSLLQGKKLDEEARKREEEKSVASEGESRLENPDAAFEAAASQAGSAADREAKAEAEAGEEEKSIASEGVSRLENPDAVSEAAAGRSRQKQRASRERPTFNQMRDEWRIDDARTLFVQGFVPSVTDEELSEAFSQFGNIVAVRRKSGGRSWAHVIFEDAASMKDASANVNNTFWHGRHLIAEPAKSKRRHQAEADTPSHTLYVGNLPYEVTDVELNDLFAELKNVTHVRVAVNKETGQPLGYAHVQFKSVDAASEALLHLDAQSVKGRNLRVTFASERRQDRSQLRRPE